MRRSEVRGEKNPCSRLCSDGIKKCVASCAPLSDGIVTRSFGMSNHLLGNFFLQQLCCRGKQAEFVSVVVIHRSASHPCGSGDIIERNNCKSAI